MPRDTVTPDVHRRVVQRDGCLAARFDPAHVCRDQWGTVHSPWDLDRLTVDHVKDQARMGKRAPSDEFHLVGMCWAGNVGVPSHALRVFEREYLRRLREEADLEG